MARIISGQATSATNAMNELADAIMTLVPYQSIDTDETNTYYKIYITQDTYIYIRGYSSSLQIYFGNSNGDLIRLSQSSVSSIFYEVIKAASGDVLVRAATSVLQENKGLQFAVVKVKNANGDESRAIFTPAAYSATATAFLTSINGYMNLIADDNIQADLTKVITAADSTSYSSVNFIYGFNTATGSAKLIPVFNTYTDFMTENFRVMAQTPRPYNGNCLINGKKYYCVGFCAMLDEV